MTSAPFFHRIVAVLLIASAGGLAACVSAPVQEMSDARQTIKAAKDAGAGRVTPQILSEAQALLEQAESSLQRRAYREARRDAIAAHDKAAEALDTLQPRPSRLQPNRSNRALPEECAECRSQEPVQVAHRSAYE